jgi:K+-sensing histidine kinase KdpD
MIKITGAQYAWLFLEPHGSIEKKEICVDYQGNILKRKEIPYSKKIVKVVKDEKKIILINDLSRDHTIVNKDNDNKGRLEFIRSVLCVPLCHFNNYLGCVYLGNNIVAGLFNSESKKIVQIISAQAGVFLENAYIIDEYKKLNKNLQYKVKEYTKDIREKNSQLVESNLKLVNSERMNNILTGTIVHDIKNYTAGIEGHIRILSRKFPDNKPIKRSLSLVTSSCIDIVNLTSNLLDIGKLEESKLEPKKEILSFDTLKSIINNQKNNVLFEERNISIKIVEPTCPFSINADEYLVTRIFQNLFSNASKYAPKNGNVCITMYSESEEDIISFFCSGIPIPEKEREVIFDKYMRSDSMRHLYSKGLGLFFCKMVASAHNGRIWVDTDSDGNYFKIAFQKRSIKVPVHH